MLKIFEFFVKALLNWNEVLFPVIKWAEAVFFMKDNPKLKGEITIAKLIFNIFLLFRLFHFLKNIFKFINMIWISAFYITDMYGFWCYLCVRAFVKTSGTLLNFGNNRSIVFSGFNLIYLVLEPEEIPLFGFALNGQDVFLCF